MKFLSYIYTPFPRPKPTKKNILGVVIFGVCASIFILLYRPFGIENTTGDFIVDLIIFSLGIVFIISVLFIEFLIPNFFPKHFRHWTMGKALIWYPLVIVFVGGIQFIYKSWLGGWHDFTMSEFLLVCLRMLGISFTVAFFVLGIWQYLIRQRFSLAASNENYTIKALDGKVVKLNLAHLLYAASDDNYVDIHYRSKGERKKLVLRSSLKNIESQLSNPLSPIRRCHRKYLVNVNHFEIKTESSRKMTIGLIDAEDLIPVSSSFIPVIKKKLTIRP